MRPWKPTELHGNGCPSAAREAASTPRRGTGMSAAVTILIVSAFTATPVPASESIPFLAGAVRPIAAPASSVRSQDEAPDLLKLVGSIPGWVRTGEIQTFAKDTLYGYIDGGAEIVIQYGFRKLVVLDYQSETASPAPKELTLEIYEMESGEAAFGLYSTKVEGGEETSPRISSAHWISPGQANVVKGNILVNILAPDLTEEEIGDIAAALEPRLPGEGTKRPPGIGWLPQRGLVTGSERFIQGPAAALNESPLLDHPFWGFGEHETKAYSARYSPFPSRVAIVDFGKETGELADLVLELFREYLRDAKLEGDTVEGRSPVGYWFLFGQDKMTGRFAALVLGEPDETTARARLVEALERASSKKASDSTFLSYLARCGTQPTRHPRRP